MAVFQLFVKTLDGRTRCLRFPSREVSSEVVKAELAASEGIPGAWQRLVSGTQELAVGSGLVADATGVFPSCTLLLRLKGGKGGFGSLLRGAATKAGQKKTSNFDACRDMSGRRLRHVNAEKKLKEWKAEAKERELEKTAEDYLRKRKKIEEEETGVAVDLEKSREESLKAREQVASAVTDGLIEERRIALDLKRKKIEALEADVKNPRLRLLGDSDLEDSEDVEDSEDENDSGASGSGKDEAGPSQPVKMDLSGASTSASSEEEGAEDHPSAADEVSSGGRMVSGSSGAEESSGHPTSSGVGVGGENCPSSSNAPEKGPAASCATEEASPSCPEKEETAQPEHPKEGALEGENQANGDLSATATQAKVLAGPLNLADYNTAGELEGLGLERLKEELQRIGLKCGGSLRERAARLWLLKTTPLDKVDRKLFLKPPRK
ncbi:hypothetical protein R1flu_003926 [Riccia fluitans]|uniref:Sde2 N-terminal ubiquitin domain-containing protein n=1 Tax=Riccia fluitans TaxID=41844 RepID=A0ABD1XEG1_9MARC